MSEATKSNSPLPAQSIGAGQGVKKQSLVSHKTPFGLTMTLLVALSQHLLAGNIMLKQADWTLSISSAGRIVSLAGKDGHELVQEVATTGDILVGMVPTGKSVAALAEKDLLVCEKAKEIGRASDFVEFEYDLTAPARLQIRATIGFGLAGGWPVLKRVVTLVPAGLPPDQDIVLVVRNNLLASPNAQHIFTPRYNGRGEELSNTPGGQWVWHLDGGARLLPGVSEQLAIPMISDAGGSPELRLTHVADPFFTTSFRIADPASKRPGEFACAYLSSKVPMTEPQTRTFWTVIHGGRPDKALEAWYATALADVPPGPDWLHEVALQHFDYLGHGGKGWFEDIDALEKRVPPEDRAKIVLALHGWYGLLGRYAFDAKTRKLGDEWVAFSNAEAVRNKGFPTSEPVRMTKRDMHRRIRYAKDRGMRVCLYFADGLNACDAVKETFAPDQVLAWGGWVGPDTQGKTYQRNPAHPDVYAWYVAYLKALLAEYGQEIDALVWDETFHVPANGGLGAATPSYAASAMMRLTQELTRMCTQCKPSLAFLSSDCAGMTFDGKDRWLQVPAYAIMSHGCYQDTECEPSVWPYGIFPNYRNTLWSCNWKAVEHFDYTRFGVEHYAAPVATSNGYLDDKGIARLSNAERTAVMELFHRRKTQRQQLKWLTGPAPEFKQTFIQK